MYIQLPKDNPLSRWLTEQNRTCDMQVNEIPWKDSREWYFDQGIFRHRTGGFFSLIGARILQHGKAETACDQPLIDQPEIGILGFLVRVGELGSEVLIQAKPEPGNVNYVQAAPSVQATESNYKRLHGGKPTCYLQFFTGDSNAQILSDSLQSEQGTRFLGKYNRNMMVLVPSECCTETSNSHAWFPVKLLLPLLIEDYFFNTDARSVIATSPWKFLAGDDLPFTRLQQQNTFCHALHQSYNSADDKLIHSIDEIVSRLEQVRLNEQFDTQKASLLELTSWQITEDSIAKTNLSTFSIKHYAVTCSGREVNNWDQPLVSNECQGKAILLCQMRNGILHFLFNARAEIGFLEGFQFGPTVQLSHDGCFLSEAAKEQELYLSELADRAEIKISCKHSDEGGRFYRCVSVNSIRLLETDQQVELTPFLIWMSLSQIEGLLQREGIFSNEARSLISMLLAYV